MSSFMIERADILKPKRSFFYARHRRTSSANMVVLTSLVHCRVDTNTAARENVSRMRST
jgi:hypothetical protein